jgi:hypothetical protein
MKKNNDFILNTIILLLLLSLLSILFYKSIYNRDTFSLQRSTVIHVDFTQVTNPIQQLERNNAILIIKVDDIVIANLVPFIESNYRNVYIYYGEIPSNFKLIVSGFSEIDIQDITRANKILEFKVIETRIDDPKIYSYSLQRLS